jgi:hypothetical protein
MEPEELSSTPSKGVFNLVNTTLRDLIQCWSPGRYPGSTQVQRVSPTAHNLLSTGHVDNTLFRLRWAAYGFRVACPVSCTRTCQSVPLLFRTRIRLVLGQVSGGLGGSVQRIM